MSFRDEIKEFWGKCKPELTILAVGVLLLFAALAGGLAICKATGSEVACKATTGLIVVGLVLTVVSRIVAVWRNPSARWGP